MIECVVRIEMPKGCGDCRIAQFGYCGITHEPVADAYMGYPENRPKACPILAVLPEGHGALIDLETAAEGLSERYNSCHMTCGAVMQFLDGLPTIVPAERSGE